MQQDKEGFYFPIIEENRCIDCGICYKSCAAIAPEYKNTDRPKCYAVWANDEIRMQSSSGGMFTLVANAVLNEGGAVCGAAWDENLNVEHIIVTDKKDLNKIRYSKYVQSNTKKAYKKTKVLLEQSKPVFFTGTPCQIAGLKKFLKKDYEKLFTADVVCHGTPSQKTWQDFLSTLPFRNEIESVNFRPKEDGWGVFKLTFILRSGKKIKLERTNPYFAGFEKALFYRQSCGVCPFNHIPRQADISLGDFWGIEHYDKPLFHTKGTSCVMVNSEKGRYIFNKVKEQMSLKKEIPLEASIKYNKCFYTPTQINEYKRWRFFKLRRSHSFEKSVELALANKFDVGIVGIWFFENYGAILTAYALYKLLNEMGFSSLLIDSSGITGNVHLQDESILSRRFFRKAKVGTTTVKRSSYELSKLNNVFDNFVLASDQLWRRPKPFGKTFFLDFAHDSKRKIAIATSFGEKYIDPPEEWPESIYHMRRLDRISVREDSGVDICREIFGVHAQQILDPVFLCQMEAYEEIINKSQKNEAEPYLLAYVLDQSPEKEQNIAGIAKQLGLKILKITDADVLKQKDLAQKGIEVEDWLYYFKNATAIITDSFHGSCFAMIFHKPFLSINNARRGASRFTSLLKLFNEEDRLLMDVDNISSHIEKLRVFDADKFNNILNAKRKESIEWIREALTYPKNNAISTYDVLVNKVSESQNGGISNEMLYLLLNRNKIYRRYYKYKVLKAISFGYKKINNKYFAAKLERERIKSFIKNLKNK